MTLFNKILENKIDYASHYSDLYIPVNDQTKKLISNYNFKCNVTTFIHQIEKTLWYDIPFAYDPYWENIEKQIDKRKN